MVRNKPSRSGGQYNILLSFEPLSFEFPCGGLNIKEMGREKSTIELDIILLCPQIKNKRDTTAISKEGARLDVRLLS